MTTEEAFAQGARCGHGDGWGRCGSYVVCEEVELSREAFANGFTSDPSDPETSQEMIRLAWLGGYQFGYRHAAEGALLPREYQYPVERKPSTWE